jgi:hypothetical protein
MMQTNRRCLTWTVVGIARALVVLAATTVPAAGQTGEGLEHFATARDVYAGARAGGLRQFDAGTGNTGTSVGAGGSVSVFVNTRWGVEAGMWAPAYATLSVWSSGTTEVRDRLLSISAVRRRGRGRIRPYALVGIAVGREDRRSHSVTRPDPRVHSQSIVWIEAGVWAYFPLRARLAVAPELRIDTLLFANIARPSISVVYRLH